MVIFSSRRRANNILNMDSSNKWALLKLKDIATENKNWKEALKHEKINESRYPS